MGIIQVMDPHLSNLIAAGEVVDRPVNIVKECVENALDAGAQTITIEVFEGGISKIIISDDGCGMSYEDALLAFARHATSKLYDQQDLFNIQTMGFRGEALASIAAVAIVHLYTFNQGEGTHICYEYGELKEYEKTSTQRGTRIEVSGLFVHTPARFKYLKKAAYEFSIISETVNKLAIANPDIRFVLKHDGRLVFQSSGKGDMKEILFGMYGRETAAAALPFQGANDDFSISGLAVMPSISRASKRFIYITINHRLVRNYQIVKAVLEGYHEFLPKERYPIVLLNIEVDPQLVDVNVHPNKLEVRLSKEEFACQLIIDTIESLFQTSLKTSQIKTKPAAVQQKMDLKYPHPVGDFNVNEQKASYQTEQNHTGQKGSSTQKSSGFQNRTSFDDQDARRESFLQTDERSFRNDSISRPEKSSQMISKADGFELEGHPMFQSTAVHNHEAAQKYAREHQIPQGALKKQLRNEFNGALPSGSFQNGPKQGFPGSETARNMDSKKTESERMNPSADLRKRQDQNYSDSESAGQNDIHDPGSNNNQNHESNKNQTENSFSDSDLNSGENQIFSDLPSNQNNLSNAGEGWENESERFLQSEDIEIQNERGTFQLSENTSSTEDCGTENSGEIGYPVPVEKFSGHEFFNHLHIIGQLRECYILCENEEGLVIIDQHAAAERYNFERLSHEFEKPVTAFQPLLVPLRIKTTPDVLCMVDELNEQLKNYGIEFESFSENSLIIRKEPLWMTSLNSVEFLSDLIDQFRTNRKVSMEQLRRHMIATAACHGSIRFNRKLNRQEMEQVILDLQKCRQPYHCPHGRPTVITLSDSRLRKEFERG